MTVEASISGVGRQPLIRGILFACISASLASCGDRAAPLAPSGQGGEGTAGSSGVSGSGGAPGGVPDGGTDLVGSDGATNNDGRVATDEGCQPIFESSRAHHRIRELRRRLEASQRGDSLPRRKDEPFESVSGDCRPIFLQERFGLCGAAGGLLRQRSPDRQAIPVLYYGCRQDSDCGAGSICQCGVVVGHCVPATCTTNADCGVGLACAKASAVQGPVAACVYWNAPISSYTCQTPMGQCQSDSTCPANGLDRGVCLFDGVHRICGTMCFHSPCELQN